MKKSLLVEIIALLFVVLFLYTGVSKLMDYAVFKEQIATSPLLRPISAWAGILLPVSEFVVAILLFLPKWRPKGLYAALGLMIIFTGYIGAILVLDDHIPCSCGGVIELLSWKGHLIFNGVLIGMALTGILLERALVKTAPVISSSLSHS